MVRNQHNTVSLLPHKITNLKSFFASFILMINKKFFKEIESFLYGEKLKYEPSLPEKMEIMRRHIGLLVKYKGEIIGMKEARMQTGWYIKGMPGAAKFRAECGSLSTTDDLEKLIENILKGN